MQVILQENYPSLGFVGDVVDVKPGFARNYLFPKKIALEASAQNVSLLEHRKRALEIKKAAKKSEAELLKDKLEGVKVVIQHASDGSRLFGSVTVTEIHADLDKQGFQIDRRLIKIESPIKTLGEHTVGVKLHQEVTAEILVVVEATPESQTAHAKEAKSKSTSKKAAPEAEEQTETKAAVEASSD